ncbi:MAG TPA: class I adenylate-forming enzyme family protein [Acidimicrobiia bacterium]|nr:class I adenylate-forming enzyme family protein [Acidimicrobiia bacterium]
MTDRAVALAELTGPGGPFEIVTEDVVGQPLFVYRERIRSLRELIERNEARADEEFLIQGERRLSYGDHNTLVRRVAAGFVARGVEPGDRVAILSANTIEWVVAFWACAAVGATAVPLNAWWKADEIEFGLADSGAKILCCDAKRGAVVESIVDGLDELTDVIVVGLDARAGKLSPWDDLLAAEDPGDLPDVPVAEDDLFAILYTSGTTGRPKGATLTHRQAIANVQNIFCASVLNTMLGTPSLETERKLAPTALLIVPLFHVTGCLSTMMLTYTQGARLVLMPPGRFDADEVMATIERERVTSFGGVPTIMWRIVESPSFEQYDLSSVVRASYGGAPAAPELVTRIHERFPSVRRTLATAYGLTETASVATSHAGDDYGAHPGSVGRPVPTVELRLADPTGREVPVGENGEVWLRGPTIMRRGYWNRPEATAEAIAADAWLRTGDIGRLDDDGYLYIVDRAKDMIIRAGENIYCVEVEQILFEHPDVFDAAVVGVPHLELGEEVKAVVHLREGSTAGRDEIRAWCATRLADFKVPEHVETREEPLPRNPAGKVLKNLLRGGDTSFSTADDAVL